MLTPQGTQRYDCTGCGDCCRGRFAVIVTAEDRARIVEQGWSADALGLTGALFTPKGGDFQLAHRADGACVFLSEDNRCRIHARFGEAAKPLACRLYPFTFAALGGQVRVDVRFDCPATAANLGRPLASHRPELLPLMKQAVPPDAPASPVPAFCDGVQLSWKALARVTEAFERVLLDVSLDITRRVAACVQLADILRHPRMAGLEGRALDDLLDEAVSVVQQDAADDEGARVPPAAAERLTFRQLAGLYGRLDTVGERAHLGQRLRVSLRMLAGRGHTPPIRPGFPAVPFAAIDAFCGVPIGDAALTLERYLHTHLSAMGFFGRSFYGRSYLDGLSALLLTYPLANWYARALAVHEGLTALNASCVQRALMIVDHQHGTTPLLNVPSERARIRFLCQPGTLRSLAVWYGS